MADYKFQDGSPDSGVLRYSDNASIPNASGNRDWKEYKEYVKDGGLTDPWQTLEEADADAKQASLDAIDQTFLELNILPVVVEVGGVDYSFDSGYESSQLIDSSRTLADNMNENDVELWDYFGNPHTFSKADSTDIAIAVGLSFRLNYSAMKHAKKIINDGE